MIMCIMNDYIKSAIHYIGSVLNYNPNIKPLDDDKLAHIPNAVSACFHFYSGEILKNPVVFAYQKEDTDFSPAKLQKQMQVVEQRTGMTVIALLDNVASYNLQRLVIQQVNFIIPQKQMFLPSLLLELKKPRTIGKDLNSQMPPIAQCILLYHLKETSLNGKSIQDLMNLFSVSYANVNRAVRWLNTQKLVSAKGNKKKQLVFKIGKKSLWKAALPMFVNPVKKTVFTDEEISNAMKSGINALSEYSMINEERHFHYAISKEAYKTLHIHTDKNYGSNVIEIWRYNPKLLSQTKIVDQLSLYLSLKDNEDERIQIELENMINKIQWLGE